MRVQRVRLDKRGRKIGRNWWREYNCSILLDAELTWQSQCEAECMDYATEIREYKMLHPRPTLKAFLLANKGMTAWYDMGVGSAELLEVPRVVGSDEPAALGAKFPETSTRPIRGTSQK